MTKQLSIVLLVLLSICPVVLFSQQTPYGGTAVTIPGQIEAENYDTGGEGFAYHDSDESNSGGAYRDEGVDIETCEDDNGGYNVGWISTGEWLEYTVNVLTDTLYRFHFRVASLSDGGIFHIEIDGTDVSGSLQFDATGDWQVYTTVTGVNIELPAGEHVLRWVAESSNFNINYMVAEYQFVPTPPVVVITEPADNRIFEYGDTIYIAASASDPDGQVVKVEFYADEELIGKDESEPYEYLWQNPGMGNWDLIAVATDNHGAQAQSEKVDVTVRFPQYDYHVFLSHPGDFYKKDFTLSLSTDAGGALIYYTLDGSNPIDSETAQSSDQMPMNISIDPGSSDHRGETPGVVVRAVAMKDGIQASKVVTKTYLFIDKVKDQDYPGWDWPQIGVNGQSWSWDMDDGVINDGRYADLIDDALLEIPSISLVMDIDSLFGGEKGIYVNAKYHGREWERPVSVELINPDGSEGFQIDAGLRIRGGWSRHDNYPKHAFRLFFREEYGKNRLEYPLFGDEGVDSFKKMDLRTSQNYAWSNGYTKENTMNRDVFSRDLQGAMGQPYTRSRYYHLYLNGMYWGIFQTQERPEANFAESYLGGDDSDYDVIKIDIGENWDIYDVEATDGNLDGYRDVWDATQRGFSSNEDYFQLQGCYADGSVNPDGKCLVDIDNLIDYMIVIFYCGNFDSPVSKFGSDTGPNNFYAIYNRNANDGFKFFAHDAEHTLLVDPYSPGIGINEDRVNIYLTNYESKKINRFEKFHPQWLHYRLSDNLEYRLRFADHIYRHFFNDGVIQSEKLTEIFMKTASMIDTAIIAESARWGNMSRSKHNAWDPIINQIVTEFFPYRGEIVLDQLEKAGLFPTIKTAVFSAGDQEIANNSIHVGSDFSLDLENPNGTQGTIYYTLDTTDPRLIGGAVSSTAINADDFATISINSTTKLLARIKEGDDWSPLHELLLLADDDLSDLRLTEIHYNPLDEGDTDGRNYEFLEMQNVGSSGLNLSQLSFIEGISYTFPTGTILNSGEYILLVSNLTAFKERYSIDAFDQYDGQLSNGGEELILVAANGDTLIDFTYSDQAPWPSEADGQGYSLVWTNGTGNYNVNDPSNWSVSEQIHGSPNGKILGIGDNQAQQIPQEYWLHRNYPNPFNPVTTIAFDIPKSSHVTLTIYNILGRTVEILTDRYYPPGFYQISWDAGQRAAGLYFYRIETQNFTKTAKMLLVK